ncbi:MAG: helix-turn-helix domain-containing protein [Ardenticatenaceae bacterium]|nr:helix-turn-helix domain-containing protein [Anaerolineales bacterium]MCB8923363.1 helix-turn-helix domain-containing protein [Ardenticatenaceae bacterium]
MSNVQIILKEGQPEYAVLPYALYLQMMEDAEMLQDVLEYDAAKQRIEEGEELIPIELTFAIINGENAVKVWREYRGMTQQELAQQADISAAYLSQIETGKRTGSTEVLQAIAKAMNLTLDDIVG